MCTKFSQYHRWVWPHVSFVLMILEFLWEVIDDLAGLDHRYSSCYLLQMAVPPNLCTSSCTSTKVKEHPIWTFFGMPSLLLTQLGTPRSTTRSLLMQVYQIMFDKHAGVSLFVRRFLDMSLQTSEVDSRRASNSLKVQPTLLLCLVQMGFISRLDTFITFLNDQELTRWHCSG